LTQVQLRLPEELVEEIDSWVKSGRFRSRSDAIKSMIEIYNEREKTREFLIMLDTRSKEAEDSPEKLIPLEESA
jgi:Arc/MetJ-type ribon-helix-helix transcriptional regulator